MFNVTIPKNKLVAFPDFERSPYSQQLVIGQPFNILKRFQYLGVNKNTGVFEMADIDGKPTSDITQATANALVNLQPKFYGGIQNSFELRGVQLDFLFQFVKQIGANYYANGVAGKFLSGSGNQPVSILQRWQKEGDITNVQKFSQNTTLNNSIIMANFSTHAYTDASYIRLKNIALSYQFDAQCVKQIGLQGLRVYAHAQNLATITGYEGLDPETRSSASLPPLRIVTIGFLASF